MTFKYNGLVWFQTIGLKETAVSDQSRFQANGGGVYNTSENINQSFFQRFCGNKHNRRMF